jgi:hypothetical protein
MKAGSGGQRDLPGSLRVFELLHDARPVLLELGEPGGFDITPWADRVQLIDAEYAGPWELPVLGVVTAPTAVLIRPDGYLAWVGDGTDIGLRDALTTWLERHDAARCRPKCSGDLICAGRRDPHDAKPRCMVDRGRAALGQLCSTTISE